MHNGQIIEVTNLNESNWMLRAQDEGYRVYLVNPYDETNPDTGITTHYNRGWYQVCEKLDETRKSYSPKRFQWVRVNDVWTTTLIDNAWLEYSRTNEGKAEKSSNTLEVITAEDQCTVRFKGVYSEAFLRNNPNENYHYIILTGLPVPVKKSRKRYEANSLSPYMAANLEVELGTNGTQYKVGDKIWVKENAPSRLTSGVLGVDWAREQDTKVFKKPHNIIDNTELNVLSTTDKSDVTEGIVKIPIGAIPVSSIDITLTYDYDDNNFGA